MKLVSPKPEFGHLLIGDLDSRGINVRIKFAFHYQARFRGCRSDEVDDDFMTDQRFASPVLADEGKQTMFDFVPFAGTRWEVTDRDFESRFVGQLLSFPFPQAHSGTITAAYSGPRNSDQAIS